jgi:hypothetical protein
MHGQEIERRAAQLDEQPRPRTLPPWAQRSPGSWKVVVYLGWMIVPPWLVGYGTKNGVAVALGVTALVVGIVTVIALVQARAAARTRRLLTEGRIVVGSIDTIDSYSYKTSTGKNLTVRYRFEGREHALTTSFSTNPGDTDFPVDRLREGGYVLVAVDSNRPGQAAIFDVA